MSASRCDLTGKELKIVADHCRLEIYESNEKDVQDIILSGSSLEFCNLRQQEERYRP
jgi:hypothetical protein